VLTVTQGWRLSCQQVSIAVKGDPQIKQAVHDAFVYDPRVDSFNPNVDVDNRIVTLSGVVDNLKAKRAAEQDAKNTWGVWRVKNLLTTRPVAPTKMAIDPICGMTVDDSSELQGKPQLMDILSSGGFDTKEFLRLAASLEQSSEHPLAAAIVRTAKEQGVAFDDLKDFRSVTAGGVLGTVAGRHVMIGKLDFLRSEKITGLELLEASATKLQAEGKTALFDPFFGLLLSPIIAGAAMSLSSVSVISNALRLRKVKL
jgi:hypothetical protein